ncbi:VOC family protein [Nocardiopsis sp. CNT-189]|uniref:VOC family protein n=1 Tax=Nocardiopsis oceanisediminis TaxID=2816862 RepID=UPI003B354242
MPSVIRTITFDCADPHALAVFWARVLDGGIHPDDVPGGDEASVIAPGGGPELLFLKVPEGKSVKNRVHLDLGPGERRRDAEVERLIGLGATRVADHRREDGGGFAVLADPEGNEFCVEISDAEIAERAARQG